MKRETYRKREIYGYRETDRKRVTGMEVVWPIFRSRLRWPRCLTGPRTGQADAAASRGAADGDELAKVRRDLMAVESALHLVRRAHCDACPFLLASLSFCLHFTHPSFSSCPFAC